MPISGAILGLVRLALACVLLTIASFEASAQGERRGSAPGDFDFYVLALSWSPPTSAPTSLRQCHRHH